VEVEDNPNSELSCFVRWATDEPATSRVEFGLDGEMQFAVSGDEPVTDHELLVIGMRPSNEYTLQAISIAEDGAELRADTLAYETGAPPFDELITEVTALDPDRMQPGWTLVNVNVKAVNHPVIAAMFDADGEPVWYFQQSAEDGRADVEVSLVDGDRVLIGAGVAPDAPAVEVDLAGEVVWEGPRQPSGSQLVEIGAMHHQFHKQPDGTYLTLLYDGKDDDLFDVIEQIDADLQTVWSWSGEQLQTDTYPWGNAALVEGDAAYYNARMTSSLTKLDRTSGEILWTFGEGGDFDADAAAEHPWPHEAHAPEITGDGTLLLYDNGGAARDFSRVVEYAIDESAMTAELIWEYPGALADDAWSTTAMGDADRQANGNTLIAAGSLIPGDSLSRVFEVTPGGDRVWEMWMSGTDGDLAATYMAERIPVMVEEL